MSSVNYVDKLRQLSWMDAKTMPLRAFTNEELQRLKRLTQESIEVTIIQPTRTGIEKAILDATGQVQTFLRTKGLHDYEAQGQGASENRVYLDANFFTEDSVFASKASLYRPNTKKGDPRIWFKGLPKHVNPDDLLALAVYRKELILINITRVDVDYVLDVLRAGPLWEVLLQISAQAQSVAQELLTKLKDIAAHGWVRSVMPQRADTAIGRTLEAALGIAINSSKAPDFKGIELKSFRRSKSKSKQNRITLFAKVANWQESKFKSSEEILDAFGYHRDGGFKLNCTVSTRTTNSQGLYFILDSVNGVLKECSHDPNIGYFATWLLSDLHAAFSAKHNETFWVAAKVHMKDGIEFFEFTDVQHTRKPILSQFDMLLDQGQITMDHLIKRDAKSKVSERGPLFKIAASALPLLFPPMQNYKL